MAAQTEPPAPPLRYTTYESEAQLPSITALIEKALSEPYSVFTYRYMPRIVATLSALQDIF